MSKCQEELDKWFNANATGSSKLVERIWQAAWNARGKVDLEICEADEAESDHEGDPAQACAANRIRKAIEQEQCK